MYNTNEYKTPCNDDLMLVRLWSRNHCHNNLTIFECFSGEWKLTPADDWQRPATGQVAIGARDASLTKTTAVFVGFLNGNHNDNFTFFNLHQQCLITLLFRILIKLLLVRPSVCSVWVHNSAKKRRKTNICWTSNTTNCIKWRRL